MKTDPDGVFMLFPSCIPVRGARNSAIYDLARHKLLLFPTAYYDVIAKLDRTFVEQTIAGNDWEHQREKVDDVIRYLLEHELAFYTDEPERFTPIDSAVLAASVISNAIIDVKEVAHDFHAIIEDLDKLGCEFLQVRGFSELLNLTAIEYVVSCARNTSIRSVEIFAKNDLAIFDEDWISLLSDNKLISRLIVHSAGGSRRIVLTEKGDMREIEFIEEELQSPDSCGRIRLKDVNAPSVPVYLETRQFNGCLNRKIAIASDGSIRNCPSMRSSFGRFGEKTLSLIASNAEFRRLWNIKKDEIDVCKDCEFRYACTDCRAYVEGGDVERGKPEKCTYDPYSGVWSGPKEHAMIVNRFSGTEIAVKYVSEEGK